jgi:hypothetical protein
MSGLIWAGLGKGIAAAGQSYGDAILKQHLMNEQDKRDLAKEDRLSAREIAKEERALAREEAKRRQFSEEVGSAYEASRDAPAKRTASGLMSMAETLPKGELSGEITPDMVRNMPQSAREIYEKEGFLSKESDPRLQRVTDAAQAAATSGSSAQTMEYFDKLKSKVLDEVKSENAVKVAEIKEEGSLQRSMIAQEGLDRRARESNESLERRANARGGSSGGKSPAEIKAMTSLDIERSTKAAMNRVARKLGVPLERVNETLTRLSRSGKPLPEGLAEDLAMLDELEGRQMDLERNDPRPSTARGVTPENKPAPTKRGVFNPKTGQIEWK